MKEGTLMKKTLSLILAILLTLTAFACFTACTADGDDFADSSADSSSADSSPQSGNNDETSIRIAVLNGTTGFGIAPLYDDLKNKKTDFSATIDFYADATLIPALIVNGSVDIAAVPTNLASTLYAKTKGGVRVLAVNTLGVLYLLENGNTVNSLADLSGKTVYVPGQGTNPEYVLKALLQLAGIADKVTIDATTYGSPDALTTALASGLAGIGLIPEPKVTAAMMQNSSLRVALDFTKEWKALTGSDLVQGCLIARADFVNNNSDLVKKFLTAYESSVNTVNSDYATAAELIVAAGLAPKAALVTKALPRCNITCLTGEEMKTSLNAFWTAMFNVIPSSIGGAVPDNAIFN